MTLPFSFRANNRSPDFTMSKHECAHFSVQLTFVLLVTLYSKVEQS